MQNKCDNCGSIVVSGHSACWQCGHMYYNVPPQPFTQNDPYQNYNYFDNDANNIQGYNQSFSGAMDYSQPLFNQSNTAYNTNYNYQDNVPYAALTFEDMVTYRKQEKTQKIFAIINIILGVLSLILVGLFLGIFALTTAMRSSVSDNHPKRISRAMTFNLIALVISIIVIVVITILLILFWNVLFDSGFIYY